jgi:radical SAM protein with 4Fe4S-binding SPASM domain
MLVTADFARKARKAKLAVQVSLDGATATTHDRIRGAGVFDRAMAGVKALVSAGVHTTVSMVVYQDNLHELGDFLHLARRLKVTQARFIPLKCIGAAADGSCATVALPTFIASAAHVLADNPALAPLLGQDAIHVLASQCRHPSTSPGCGAGVETLLLDANGKLYPCLNMNRAEYCWGDIRSSGFDLATEWRNNTVLTRLRVEGDQESSTHGCHTCAVRRFCRGGCRGEVLAANRAINDRSPDCQERRQGMLDMCWLLAEHPAWLKTHAR